MRRRDSSVESQKRILNFVTRANWLLFVITSAVGFIMFTPVFAGGIFCGGLIVTLNFHMLARTLRSALAPPHLSSHNVIIAKYYLRFIASGFIIFVLIAGRIVHPVGLVIGLSIVVLSIMLASVLEVKKLIFKEAV
jgi:hypothetical protein